MTVKLAKVLITDPNGETIWFVKEGMEFAVQVFISNDTGQRQYATAMVAVRRPDGTEEQQSFRFTLQPADYPTVGAFRFVGKKNVGITTINVSLLFEGGQSLEPYTVYLLETGDVGQLLLPDLVK